MKDIMNRLNDILYELDKLNTNIGKLVLYINTIKEDNNKEKQSNVNILEAQLLYMLDYRDMLQKRIIEGIY